MEQTTLKYLRILIPGIIFLLGIYPLYNHYFNDVYDVKSLDVTYVTYLSILFGAIYYQLNIRHLLTRWSYNQINNNIYTKLLETYDKSLNKSQKDLIKNEKYLNIFYRIIDNDESLKKRTNNVYFNGIFWTSTADSVILSAFFSIIYYWFFPNVKDAKSLAELFFTISIASLILHVLSIRKHIKLSNNQLNFIKDNKKIDVLNYIDEVLLQIPLVEIEKKTK